jgi:hypothetical protein
MPIVSIALIVLALFSFILGAFNITSSGSSRINWQSLGLAFLATALLLWRT